MVEHQNVHACYNLNHAPCSLHGIILIALNTRSMLLNTRFDMWCINRTSQFLDGIQLVHGNAYNNQ